MIIMVRYAEENRVM